MTIGFNIYSHILSQLMKIFPPTCEHILLCFHHVRGCKDVLQLLAFANWMKERGPTKHLHLSPVFSHCCSGSTQLSAAGQAWNTRFLLPSLLLIYDPAYVFLCLLFEGGCTSANAQMYHRDDSHKGILLNAQERQPVKQLDVCKTLIKGKISRATLSTSLRTSMNVGCRVGIPDQHVAPKGTSMNPELHVQAPQ